MKKLLCSVMAILLFFVLIVSFAGCTKTYTVTFVSYVKKASLHKSEPLTYDVYLEKEIKKGAIIGDIEIDDTLELYDTKTHQTRTYKFCGWFTDKSFGIQWNLMSDPVNGNITLYSKWEPVS